MVFTKLEKKEQNNNKITVLEDFNFEAPKTTKENGSANYVYEIVQSSNNEFKVKATAITDFNGNGVFNVWEIDQNGVPKQMWSIFEQVRFDQRGESGQINVGSPFPAAVRYTG